MTQMVMSSKTEYRSSLAHPAKSQRIELPEDYRDLNHPLHPGDVEAQKEFNQPPEERQPDTYVIRNTICYIMLTLIFLILLSFTIMSGIVLTRRKFQSSLHPQESLEPTTIYVTKVVTFTTQVANEVLLTQITKTAVVTLMPSQGKNTDWLLEF